MKFNIKVEEKIAFVIRLKNFLTFSAASYRSKCFLFLGGELLKEQINEKEILRSKEEKEF